jgi:hypothetical protein
MEGVKDETAKKTLPQKLMVFDPEHPPYAPQHLCEYLRELDEEEEREGSNPGTS